jgi:GDPmannose 4,6-dehydratase
MGKTALITGITGQDGSYLAELLVGKNYRVVGLSRRSSFSNSPNLSTLRGKIEFAYCDLLDTFSIAEAVRKYQPDEIYNLASQSYPSESWRLAIETAEINGIGAHRIYEAVRQVKPNCKIYQASSSEMYGTQLESPQDESTPFRPVNPYGAAKLYAHNLADIYVKSYDMFIACGILFNHESPRRGLHFLSQKVSYGAACLKLGITNSSDLNEEGDPIVKNGRIALGNLQSRRDWGFAGDYVEAMWLMLQQPKPVNFVIGTGELRTVEQLCETAFAFAGLRWQDHVEVDKRFFRLTETGATVANAAKAKSELHWEPRTSFRKLVGMMVDHQIHRLQSHA